MAPRISSPTRIHCSGPKRVCRPTLVSKMSTSGRGDSSAPLNPPPPTSRFSMSRSGTGRRVFISLRTRSAIQSAREQCAGFCYLHRPPESLVYREAEGGKPELVLMEAEPQLRSISATARASHLAVNLNSEAGRGREGYTSDRTRRGNKIFLSYRDRQHGCTRRRSMA